MALDSTLLGLILDSSVIIAAERRQQPMSELLASIRTTAGVTDILLSAIKVSRRASRQRNPATVR